MRIRELLLMELADERQGMPNSMGGDSATQPMASPMQSPMAQPMQTAQAGGTGPAGPVGPNSDWNPHGMGSPGSVPGFQSPRSPVPSPSGQQPMKVAGLGDTISNFFTTPQPIGGQPAGKQEPSSIQNAIGNSSFNPFSPVNKALQGASQGASQAPPPRR